MRLIDLDLLMEKAVCSSGYFFVKSAVQDVPVITIPDGVLLEKLRDAGTQDCRREAR